MQLARELLERRALESAPVALAQLPPAHRVELGQRALVLGNVEVGGAVVDAGRDEDHAGLALGDEAALDPAVADAARVRGRAHPQRHLGVGEAPEAREEVGVLALGELGQLVEADELELSRLVVVDVVLGLAVAERERRAGGEAPGLRLVVPARVGARQPLVGAVHQGARAS